MAKPNKPVHNRDPEDMNILMYVPGLRIKNAARRLRRMITEHRVLKRDVDELKKIVKPGANEGQ